ncbi:MAG: hypothetical protein K0Q49_1234 [Haloplasmataceae bacterium]|nr:hypothetical protein [Haloplasmataceae bacterium]
MVYKSEKLLIKISAILGIINLVLLLIGGYVLEAFSDEPKFADMLARYGLTGVDNIFKFSFIIMLILRIIVILILFMIAKKLDKNNYKTYGILSIVIGIISYKWLLGYLSSILLIIAGILILVNSKKTTEQSK